MRLRKAKLRTSFSSAGREGESRGGAGPPEGGREPGQEVPLLFGLRVLHLLQVLLELLEPGVSRGQVGQDELLLHEPDVVRRG